MHHAKMSRDFQPDGGRPSARHRCRRITWVLMILLLPGLLGAWKVISGETIDRRHVERIKDGKTTKNEILLLFGDPQEIDRTPEGVTYTYKNFKDAPAKPYNPNDRKIAPQSDQLLPPSMIIKQIKKRYRKDRRQDPEEHPAHSLQTRWTDGDEPRIQRILRGAGMTAFTDLAQATAWVFDLQKFGIKFGLSSTLKPPGPAEAALPGRPLHPHCRHQRQRVGGGHAQRHLEPGRLSRGPVHFAAPGEL